MYLSNPSSFYVLDNYIDINYIPIFYEPYLYIGEYILVINEVQLVQEFYDYYYLINKTLTREGMVIGVSLPEQKNEVWIRLARDIKEYAKDKGVTVKVENADFDSSKQMSQIENLIAQGINVLIVVSTLGLNAIDVVEKAHKAGIKVIEYEMPMPNSDVDLYITFNKITIGELQGKYLTEKVPRGNFIILSGEPDGVFREGAMEYIKPLANAGDIKILADKAIKDWNPKIAYEVVKAVLAKNTKVDAILAPNDVLAGAAIEALKEKGLAGKVVVTGQDADIAAIRRIIERTQSMTVLKDSRVAAKAIIDAAMKLSSGENIIVNGEINNGKKNIPTIYLIPQVIDNDNLKSVLIDSGYVKQSVIYGG